LLYGGKCKKGDEKEKPRKRLGEVWEEEDVGEVHSQGGEYLVGEGA